jgi:hypothetical protein
VCITPSICIQPIPELRISILSPPAGPLEGGTKLVLIGDGFRDFGPLMRCRFGAAEVPMSLTRPPGGCSSSGPDVEPFPRHLPPCGRHGHFS